MAEYAAKKDLEEFKNDVKNEFKRHTGILLEDFKTKIDFVIDQQQDMRREINQRFEDVNHNIDSLHAEIIIHRDNAEVHIKQQRNTRFINL